MNVDEEREGLIKFDPEEADYCSSLLDEIDKLQNGLKKIIVFCDGDDSGENIPAILSIIDQECEISL